MNSNDEFESWWATVNQTIGKVAAKAAWDIQQKRIDELLHDIMVYRSMLDNNGSQDEITMAYCDLIAHVPPEDE